MAVAGVVPWSRLLSLLVVLCASGSAVAGAQSAASAAAARAAEAHVEPGDRIAVKVRREPLLSDTVTVNGRGDIVLARIGSVPAATLTIRAIEDTLRARYATFLRNPAVDVTVLRRIAVNGSVGLPNVYYVDVAMTLRDVIARAGGITEAGSPSKVYVVRQGVRTKASHWQDDTSLASDLHSGDEVLVEMRPWLERNALSVASAGVAITSVILTIIRR